MRRSFLRKYWVKGLRRLCRRHGHGVHSPFAYDLIRTVIEEDASYYRYEEIERLRRKVLRRRLSRRERLLRGGIPFKRGALLLRLVNRFRPETVVEIGTDWGVSTRYLHAGNPEARICSLVLSPRTESVAEELLADCGPQVEAVRTEDPVAELRERLATLGRVDCAVVCAGVSPAFWPGIFEVLKPRLGDRAVLLFENIHADGVRRRFWKQLRRDESFRVSMDLYDFGLLIRSGKLNKQHYDVSF